MNLKPRREDTLRLHQRFALFVHIFRVVFLFRLFSFYAFRSDAHAIPLCIVVRQKCAYVKIRLARCPLGSSPVSFFVIVEQI